MNVEKVTGRWHELGRAPCGRKEECGPTGGDLTQTLIFAVSCKSQQMLDTEVYVSKSVSGNPLEVVLAAHPPAYLTNTVKEVVIGFVQERFMLWKYWTSTTLIQNSERQKGRVASKIVAFIKHYSYLSKEMMWNVLLVFDKLVAWLAWGRRKRDASVPADTVVGSLLWSWLTFLWLDPSASDYSITWLPQAVISPLLTKFCLGHWTELKWSGALLWSQANESQE